MNNTAPTATDLMTCRKCKSKLNQIYTEIETPIRYYYNIDSKGLYNEEDDYQVGVKENHLGVFCGQCHKELSQEQQAYFWEHEA